MLIAGGNLAASFDQAGNLLGLGRPGHDSEWLFAPAAPNGAELPILETPPRSLGGTELRVERVWEGWRVSERWRVRSRYGVLERTVTVSNVSAAPAYLRGFKLSLPPLVCPVGAAVVLPGALPPGDRPLPQSGEVVRPLDNNIPYFDPLAFAWDPGSRRALGSWFYSESEYVAGEVGGVEAGLLFEHTVNVLARLGPGEGVCLGHQYVWVARGSRRQCLRSARRAHNAAGVRAPSDRIAGLEGKVIYCCHPGGTPEQYFRGQTFDDLAARVPELQRMGIDLVWLLPVFEHGDGQKWNLYSPFDHREVSALYGGEAGLRQFASCLEDAGIGLLLDVVPHGPPDDTNLARDHPDWVTLDEEQKPVYSWGQLAFDNANPDWQAWMAAAMQRWAASLPLAGLRIDVAQGGPANWDRHAHHHASYSTLGGGLEMTRALRKAVVREAGSAVVLPEEWTGATPFMRRADVVYDFQLYFLMLELQGRSASPEEWASSLQSFLSDQQAATPPGGLRMRFTCHHDTVLHWGLGRPRDLWGDGRARALLTLNLLIDGVPMVLAGEEDRSVFNHLEPNAEMVEWAVQLSREPIMYAPKAWPRRPESADDVRARVAASGPSQGALIAAVTALRRATPALLGGVAAYDVVRATGGVFACLRGLGPDRVLVLVSLNGAAVESRVDLPDGLRAGYWQDLQEGSSHHAEGGALVVRIPPWGFRVLGPG